MGPAVSQSVPRSHVLIESLPCNMSDRASLFEELKPVVETLDYSLSVGQAMRTFVQRCPQACLIPYGTGNPDVSGPGVMISYIVQAVLALIFGVLFVNIILHYEFGRARPSGRDALIYEAAKNIAVEVAKVNLFVSIAVSIAIAVRCNQLPTISETNFLLPLADLQSYVVTASTGAIVVVFLSSKQDGSNKQYLGLLFTGIACMLIAWLIRLFMFASNTLPMTQEIILLWLQGVCLTATTSPEIRTPSDAFSTFTEGLLVAIGTVGGCLVAAMLLMLSYRILTMSPRFKAKADKLSSAHAKFTVRIISSVCAIVWTVEVAREMNTLLQARAYVQKISGNLYQDSNWGFGQVLALVTWVALLNGVALEFLDLFFSLRARRRQQSMLTPSAPRVPHVAQYTRQPIASLSYYPVANADMTQGSGDRDDLGQAAQDGHLDGPSTGNCERDGHSSGHQQDMATKIASSDPQVGIVQQRTWPRNGSGMYLPRSESERTL